MSDTPAPVAGARHSIRWRLLGLALLPLGIVLPLVLATLAHWGDSYFDRLLVTKVGADLVVANSYYDRVAAGIGASVDGLAGSSRLATLLAPAPHETGTDHKDWLNTERLRLKLDFLHLLAPDGCPAPGRQAARIPCFGGWPVIDSARRGQSRTENDIFPTPLLEAIDPILARQSDIPLLPTRNAAPDAQQAEQRGLVVHSAAPVFDRRGRLVGILAGGVSDRVRPIAIGENVFQKHH